MRDFVTAKWVNRVGHALGSEVLALSRDQMISGPGRLLGSRDMDGEKDVILQPSQKRDCMIPSAYRVLKLPAGSRCELTEVIRVQRGRPGYHSFHSPFGGHLLDSSIAQASNQLLSLGAPSSTTNLVF